MRAPSSPVVAPGVALEGGDARLELAVLAPLQAQFEDRPTGAQPDALRFGLLREGAQGRGREGCRVGQARHGQVDRRPAGVFDPGAEGGVLEPAVDRPLPDARLLRRILNRAAGCSR